MAFSSFNMSQPIEPLPLTLPSGTNTVECRTLEGGKVVAWRWTLNGEATLRLSSEYVGDWRCEGRKSTSFVRFTLVDWDQARREIPSTVADSKNLRSTERDT